MPDSPSAEANPFDRNLVTRCQRPDNQFGYMKPNVPRLVQVIPIAKSELSWETIIQVIQTFRTVW
jgi:hypothetical protein